MNRIARTIILALIVGFTILAVFLIASRPKPTLVAAYETKEVEGGEVTVSVTPIRLKKGFPASFDVAFETHSVDLAFDVEKIAAFTDGTKETYTPVWEGSPPGGHHRKGMLRFIPDLTRPKMMTLTFRDIAGIPTRTFTWEVK